MNRTEARKKYLTWNERAAYIIICICTLGLAAYAKIIIQRALIDAQNEK